MPKNNKNGTDNIDILHEVFQDLNRIQDLVESLEAIVINRERKRKDRKDARL